MDWEYTFKVESISGNWLFFKGIFTGCSNSHNSINVQQYYVGQKYLGRKKSETPITVFYSVFLSMI